MRSVIICVFTYVRFNFSKNPTKNNFVIHTYSTKRHLTVIISSFRNTSQPDETPEPPKNYEIPISDIPIDTPNQHYHNRDVALAAEVKYENNRYITPINVSFGSTESDSTVKSYQNTVSSSPPSISLTLPQNSLPMTILSSTTPKSSP